MKSKRVIFIGSKQIGFECLKLMYRLNKKDLIGAVTIDDQKDTRTCYREIKNFCEQEKIKLHLVKDRSEFNRIIKKIKPDFGIVVGWYWMIDADVLKTVSGGFVGIHASLLPKYRGGAPLVWAMINGEQSAGVTLFSFTEGMDDGGIWGQKRIKVKDSDYISDVLLKIEKQALLLIKENYLKILSNSKKPKIQNHRLATYCALRIPEDGKICWHKSSQEIYNFIRAQSAPYPGAFTFNCGKKIIIWKARPLKMIYYGTPGQVVKIAEEGVYVVCGDQMPLVLEIIQEENGQKMAAQALIKTFKTRFGSQ